MSKAKPKRRTFMERILGKAEVSAAISGLQDALDGMGLQRKEMTKEMTAVEKAIMETLVTDVGKFLAKLTDNPPEGLATEIIASVMGALAQLGDEEAPEAEVVPEEEVEVMTDDEEDDEEVPEAFMELKEEMLAVAKDTAAAQRDMAQLIPQLVEVVKAVTPVLPVLDGIGDLVERMTALEKQYKLRPRASRAKGTIVEDPAGAEALKETDAPKTVLGHRVKE